MLLGANCVIAIQNILACNCMAKSMPTIHFLTLIFPYIALLLLMGQCRSDSIILIQVSLSNIGSFSSIKCSKSSHLTNSAKSLFRTFVNCFEYELNNDAFRIQPTLCRWTSISSLFQNLFTGWEWLRWSFLYLNINL